MNTLTTRKPQTPAETRKAWAAMGPPERRRRVLELMQARNEAAEDGTHPAREALVALMVAHWHHHKARAPSRHTVNAYRRAVLDLFEHWHDHEVRANDPTLSTWESPGIDGAQAFASHLTDPEADGGSGLHPATARLKLSGVAAFYRALVWTGFTTDAANPWPRVGMPEDPDEAHAKRDHYEVPEVERMLQTARELRDQADTAGDHAEADRRHGDVLVLLLGAHAGLRAGEMVGIRWADVRIDAEQPMLTVPGSITRNGETVRVAKRGVTRHVPISHELAAELRRAWRPEGEVLPYNTPSRLHQRFRVIQQAAGLTRDLSGMGVHALRHTFGTRVYAMTRDLGVTQRLLGHKSVSTTQRYAKGETSQLREAITAAWG